MKIIKIFSLLFFFSGCSAGISNSNPAAAAPTVAPESSACTTSTVYAASVTITGTASFYKRGLNLTNVGATVTKITLSSPIMTPLPIKFAEVQVLNSAGVVVQCGQTNASGALKALDGISNLVIPNTPGNYTVNVLSRAQHVMTVPMGKTSFSFVASVKSDIYANKVYSLSQSLISSGSGSVAVNNLIAYAREEQTPDVIGGAFNIYNSILTTYEYLAQNTTTSNLTCLNPKLDVYWKVGFNPAQYLYPSSDPATLGTLSYYVRGQNQLFINGGQQGEIKISDTDHFDDSVIIHEFGHHVEDVCGKMDSPGGTHYGLYRIDSRLAWSEGWGNFFGAHMIRNNVSSLNPDLVAQLAAISTDGWMYYLDTTGYTDAGTGVSSGAEYIRLNFTKAGNNPESVSTANGTRYFDKVDSTLNPGEGLVREVSVSRSLYKSTNTCASGCSGTNYFSKIWQALENDPAGIGMGKSAYPFRSPARFYSRLNQAFSGSMPAAIDSILNTDEAQQRESNAAYTVGGFRVEVPYGIKLVATGATLCSLKLQPRTDSGLDSNNLSDQRFSNHYYYVDLSSLSGVNEIWLTVSKVAGTTLDIDSILYNEGYRYDEDCIAVALNGTCTAGQKTTSADMARYDRTAGNGVKKLLNLSALNAAGKYLLNIRAFTAGIPIAAGTEYSYTLTDQSGGNLCPTATY